MEGLEELFGIRELLGKGDPFGAGDGKRSLWKLEAIRERMVGRSNKSGRWEQ